MNDIALELPPGEALEVAISSISSSLAPNHPNPNTGLGYAGDSPPVVVRQTVCQGGHDPSRLVLRVVPAERGSNQTAGHASEEAAT